MRKRDLERLRSASARFAVVAILATILLVGFVAARLIEHGSVGDGDVREFVVRTVYLLPALFYAGALIALYRTFHEISRGATFERAIERGMRQLGWALICCGAASAILVPATMATLNHIALISGSDHRPIYRVQIDAAHLMLAFTGAAMLLLARLFRLAAIYKLRKDEAEAELREIV